MVTAFTGVDIVLFLLCVVCFKWLVTSVSGLYVFLGVDVDARIGEGL